MGSYAKYNAWDCVACPDPAMVYDTASKNCKCKTGYVEAGFESCVTADNELALGSYGYNPPSTTNLVTYYSMVNSKGPLADDFTVESDVFH